MPELHELTGQFQERLEIETVDIYDQTEVAELRKRLAWRVFDMLLVNAGTTTSEEMVAVGDVTTDEFARVMVTNALCPMQVVESLQSLVSANGLIGPMSSGQGNIANNTTGMREVYRSSKAALNQFMRSYAARNLGTPRAMVFNGSWLGTYRLGRP